MANLAEKFASSTRGGGGLNATGGSRKSTNKQVGFGGGGRSDTQQEDEEEEDEFEDAPGHHQRTPTGPGRERQVAENEFPQTPAAERTRLTRIIGEDTAPDLEGIAGVMLEKIRTTKTTAQQMKASKTLPTRYAVPETELNDILFLAERLYRLAQRSSEFSLGAVNQTMQRLSTRIVELTAAVGTIAEDVETVKNTERTASQTYAGAVGGQGRAGSEGPVSPNGGHHHQHRHDKPDTPDTTFTLNQRNPKEPVFADIATPMLADKINTAIQAAGVKSPIGRTISVRGVVRHRSGDLRILAKSVIDKDALTDPDNVTRWIAELTDGLTFRQKTYPIIIHGMPTEEFDPENANDVKEMCKGNEAYLSSWDHAHWANEKAAKEKKHSSLIVHLRSAKEANGAVKNSICYRYDVKRTQVSIRPAPQCYKCHRFGHMAAACPEAEERCSHCATAGHRYGSCPKKDDSPVCAFCFDELRRRGTTTVPPGGDGLPFNPFHNALDLRCPRRQRARRAAASIPTPYDESNE